MPCSLGFIDGDTTVCNEEKKPRSNFSKDVKRLLKIRSGSRQEISLVCDVHYRKFVFNYPSHQKWCCDPFMLHTNRFVKGSSPPISLNLRDRAKSIGLRLVPGKKLCIQCNIQISKDIKAARGHTSVVESSPSLPSSSRESDPPSSDSPQVASQGSGSSFEDPASSSLQDINKWLQSNGKDPIDLHKLKYQANYFDEILHSIQQVLETICGSTSIPRNSIQEVRVNAAYFEEVLQQLKIFIENCDSNSDLVCALSVLPLSLTVSEIENYFNVSERLVKKTKSLIQEKGILCSPNPRAGKTLKDESVNAVLEFYYRQDISWELPGKSNAVSVKENGSRTSKQKRLLLGNVSHLHQKFCEDNPGIKVSKSKFATLRPKECILSGSTGTHNVCVCTIHENAKLMFSGAQVKQLTSIASITECVNYFLCSSSTVDCYLRLCKDCPDASDLKELLEVAFDTEMVDTVTYNQWETTDRSNILTHVRPVFEFVDDFIVSLEELVTHHFIAKSQAEFYNHTLSQLQEGVVVINADFAENLTFLVQDSVQDFYFHNRQATIHPFCCYYNDPSDSKLKQLSMSVISDCVDHSTLAVHAFQKKLQEELKKLLPNIKKVIYFSDGSSALYKNKKNVANIWYHEADFGIPAEWHFFGASHGKSACDGIGGMLKRLASLYCLQHTEPGTQITTPRKFYEWAKVNIKDIISIWVSEADVKEMEEKLKVRFGTVKDIPGTISCHAIIPLKENAVLIKRYSNAITGERCKVSTQEYGLQTADIRGFVSVFENNSAEWYLSYVEEPVDGGKLFLVKPLQPSAGKEKNHYQFSDETKLVSFNNILTVVQPRITSKGQAVIVSNADINTIKMALKDKMTM